MNDSGMYRDEITAQVEKILENDLFKGAKRSRSFLKYVSTQVLNGESDKIKEFSIAVDAFGLETTFDQQIDPRIRVEAKRLRDRLTQYYEGPGKNDHIHIEIPKGSYIPVFNFNSNADECNESSGSSEGTDGSLCILIDRRFNAKISFLNTGFLENDPSIRTFQSRLVSQLFNHTDTGTMGMALSDLITLQERATPMALDLHTIREPGTILLDIRIKLMPSGILIHNRSESLSEEDFTACETSLLKSNEIVENLLEFFRSLR